MNPLACKIVEPLNFDTHFVELDKKRYVSTSDSNFGIFDDSLPSNWRTISVNNDEIIIATKDNQVFVKRLVELQPFEQQALNSTKTLLASVIRIGPFRVRSETGFIRITTWDRIGNSTTMGTAGTGISAALATTEDGTVWSKTGKDNYIVSKRDFKFNWDRVFFDWDVVSIVYRSGRVLVLPQGFLRPDEKEEIEALKNLVTEAAKKEEAKLDALKSPVEHPMDVIRKAFGNFG